MKRQLCWLRNDLRISDNSALLEALKRGPTIVIYVATPAQWQVHDDAPIKQDFWRRNLKELMSALASLKVPLRLFQVPDYQSIPVLLEKIIQYWNIEALHYNIDYPLNERRRDELVSALCREKLIRVFAYEDHCLLPPELVLTGQDKPFKVFTPYANKCREYLEQSGPPGLHKLSADAIQPIISLEPLAEECMLDEIDWPQPETAWQELWPAGEAEARRRLIGFVDERLKDYQEQRDFPAQAGTSSLSPYLNAGVISSRECWKQAQDMASNVSVRSWCNELLWRDFYQYVVWHYPHVCKNQAWNPAYAELQWRSDEDEFERWSQGETGFPLIDAAMKQLLATGWMHNRLRMLVAMFLSKNLMIDWRWGERWFMQHLVDGEFSANNGGWQWSASTGTDAAPYFRIFNPIRQSERFDPQGEFIKNYIPVLQNESAKTIHDPAKLQTNYWDPLVELKFSRERALAAFKQKA
jgi:deoxyribodipyrimidine photo-lyase